MSGSSLTPWPLEGYWSPPREASTTLNVNTLPPHATKLGSHLPEEFPTRSELPPP
eukprot:CAMPEP_0180304806 /NCGR_PEP_ID=MMETSP0988-20121125/26013_1 /TAXON_ID=697907 /ORGANISM="non described non described, Strain CCMP2293" /LENGTH=54 /DNA_ID=CAMNT_0022287045 /DNA_START=77 /DNA_END=237 /DNA_ORIENTATION=+